MKKLLPLFFLLTTMFAAGTKAQEVLKVKPVKGDTSDYVIVKINKLTFGADSMYVWMKDNSRSGYPLSSLVTMKFGFASNNTDTTTNPGSNPTDTTSAVHESTLVHTLWYPNPVTSILNLKVTGTNGTVQVKSEGCPAVFNSTIF